MPKQSDKPAGRQFATAQPKTDERYALGLKFLSVYSLVHKGNYDVVVFIVGNAEPHETTLGSSLVKAADYVQYLHADRTEWSSMEFAINSSGRIQRQS